MSENIAQQVKQLANRLENATNTERVDALQDLQGISKQSPEASKIVGELALKKVLDFLKEQGSSEEYQEALDLIYRLVKNKTAGKGNTELILGETGSVELLLDLLEHEDLMVGVMSSQILTEIHSNDGATLESQIMMCPDGMNKLLQRLPDRSREEVRNQAVILIQQLTSVNDQMRMQVMFNEGMEIVFEIIRTEGAANDAGLVVQDCLQICCNILKGSDNCQRLFFSMCGVAYILRLSDFFDPQIESKFQLQDADDDDNRSGGGAGVPWFDQPTRLACAMLALSALCNSLSSRNVQYQKAVGKDTSIVVPSAAFWIARRGPVQLVNAALSLLHRVVEGNVDMALQLSQEQIKISPAALGRNIPHGIEVPGLQFSWRPSHEDDRRLISLMSLLVERYVYAGETWHVDDGLHLSVGLNLDYDVSAGADAFAVGCLRVFETVLAAGPDTSDFLVQCVLAPIAMFDDAPDGHPQKQLESMRPLGLLLLNLLVEGSQKIVAGHQQQYGGALKSDIMITTEKAANVLALVFVHGSSLARELSTRIMTSHISVQVAGVTTNTFLIPILLGFASSAARISGGGGFPLLVAILRLMATVVTECEPAAKLMLENASNLFVVDLASVTSENTGTPSLVQVAACLFLGCCLDALKDPEGEGDSSASPHDGHGFTKQSFIGMIDARIGLGRFSDILKKPFSTSTKEQSAMSSFFFSPSFQSFYIKRVEIVKKGIMDYYTGAGSGSIDAAHQAVINMQQERIAELEGQVSTLMTGGTIVVAAPAVENAPAVQIVDDSHIQQIQLLQDKIAQRTLAQESAEGKLDQMTRLCDEQVHQLEALEATRDRLETQIADNVAGFSVDSQQLQDSLEASRAEVAHLEEALRVAQHESIKEESRALEAEALNDELRDRLQTALLMSDEVLSLKQTVLQDGEEQRRLQEAVTQRDRKLDLLQSELDGLAISRDTSALDRKVADLESRNAQLKQQMWAVESELQAAKLQIENSVANDEGDKSLDAMEDLLPTVTQFVLNLGLSLEATPTGASAAQLGVFMESLLNQCGEAISAAVNQCSDLAEGAQLSNLQGGEGSVTRFLDCCVRLSEELLETRARAEEADRLRVMLADSETEVEEERTARQAADADFLEQQDQTESLRADIERLTVDLQRLIVEKEALNTQLASQTDAAGLVDKNLFVRIDYLTQEGVDLREQVVQLTATNERLSMSLSSEEASLNEQIGRLTQEGVELREQVAQLTATNERLSMSLSSEEASLNEQIGRLTQEGVELREQVAQLTSEASDVTNEVFDLQHQLSEAQSRESELNDITVSHEQALQHSNSEHQSQLDELHADINALQLTLNAAQAAHSQDEQTAYALAQLQEQIAALETEKSRTANAAEEERGVAHAQLQSFSEINTGLEDDKERLIAQTESLTAQLTQLQDELAQTERAREAADEAIQTLQTQLRAVGTEAAALGGQHEMVVAHLATIDALTADLTRLTVELSDSQEIVSAGESTIATLTEQLTELNKQMDALQGASADELEAAATSASTIARLTGELDDIREIVAARDSTIATLTDQLVGLTDQLALLTSEQKERDTVVAASESVIISLNNDIERLTEQLTSTETTTSSVAQSTIASLNVEIERLTEDLRRTEETAADESASLNFDVERLKSTLQSVEEDAMVTSATLNAELTRLLGELTTAQDAAEELRERQATLESTAGMADEQKERVVELQKKVNDLHTVVADLQAKAQFDAKTHSEALSVERAHCLVVNEKIGELQIIHQSLVSELSQLKQDKSSLEARLLEAQSAFERVETELSNKTVQGYNQSLENEGLKATVSKKEAEMAALQSAFEGERQRIESRLAIETSSDPFKAQDHELRRLAASADRLSKELHTKEQELHTTQAHLRRKEGEVAGIKASLAGCEADMEQLRVENEVLSNQGVASERLLKDLRREQTNLEASLQLERGELEGLRSQLQSERSRLQLTESVTSQHSELVVRVEKKLRDLSTWMMSSFGLSAGTGRSAFEEALLLQTAGGGHSLVEYVDSLRALIETLAGRLGAQVREQHDKLIETEKRLTEAVQEAQHQRNLHQQQLAQSQYQASQQRSSASTSLSSPLFENMVTPAKKNPLNGHSSSHDLSGGMLTPIPHKGEGHSLILHSDTLVKSAPRTGSKLTISPGAKDAGRLNAEVLREKRKLSALQEQHSDLLGLLAQQEVEMGVFKQALEDKLSASELLRLEEQAQRSVIDLYGTYTDFRHYEGGGGTGLLDNH